MMRPAARTFINPVDSVPYCHELGVTDAILEWAQIPGCQERGYLDAADITDALEVLDKGGIACSVFVSETIPVIGQDPQNNPIAQNAIRSIRAMGTAGVSTVLQYMLEEVGEGVDRETVWSDFAANYGRVVEAAAEAGVNLAMHSFCKPIGLVDGNEFLSRCFAELPALSNGICYDPGISVLCGDEPLEGLTLFADRIHMVQIRDVTGDWTTVEEMRRDAFSLEIFPGKGVARCAEAMQGLAEIGYDGVVQPEHLGLPSEAELLPAAFRWVRDHIAT